MDFDPSREWLETNGIGGFASGTVAGCNTRRYHALLCAAVEPPRGRMVLVNKVDEMLQIDRQLFPLSCNYFPGEISPEGYRQLQQFSVSPLPHWIYQAENCILEKTLWMPNGQNRTVLRYHLRSGKKLQLRVRPFVTGRFYHSLLRKNDAYNTGIRTDKNDEISLQPGADCPPIIFNFDGEFEQSSDWYYNFEYPQERERGLDFQEDAFSPGEFVWELAPGQSALLIFSTRPLQLSQTASKSSRTLWRDNEIKRHQILESTFTSPELKRLARAADQFLVRREDDRRHTMIAGYPWFTDWGRDTMISLTGICLCTKRYYQAAAILLHFAEFVSGGMIPNRFPDAGELPEYNTADATLWFFHATAQYLQYSGDHKTVFGKLYPALRECMQSHIDGTRYGIKADEEDGLLHCGENDTQLTWMDARVNGVPVTPRSGKPVEIQALWHNALHVLTDLARLNEDPATAKLCAPWIEKIQRNFQAKFWNPDKDCLYDVIDITGTDHQKDGSVRPNQVFAMSLPHDLLDNETAQKVLLTVRRQLLTPYGLRSLSPEDPQYQGIYRGDVPHRDGAYHQGTVWPWLMGPFLSAYLKTHQHSDAAKAQAREWLQPLLDHLDQACTGTISEIFDGNAPHTPRGCPAQAWSVAEVLRVLSSEF
jgi:predicted glycogen debranching enzyme